jgi:glucuronokinase
MIIESRAFARAGLLGNPSDGYFGKTISIIIRNFGAIVTLYESPELVIEDQEMDRNQFRNIRQLIDTVRATGYYGGSRLIKASIKKFGEYCEKRGTKLNSANFRIGYQTSIPRQVGLAGSSALITATMKALMKFYGVDIPKPELPGIILSTEVDELGINAGLQDRVIQVYEGCVFMDFNKEHFDEKGYGIYETLDHKLLPKLYLAYKTDLSKESGKVLNNVRERFYGGDQEVIDTLHDIGELAEEGKKALLSKDYDTLNQLINKNFDFRCKIMKVSDSNKMMVSIARECGASAKFSGSGGAVIGVYENDDMLRRLMVRLKKINVRVIKPFII